MKNSYKLLYITRSNIFETGRQFLNTCLSPFLWTRTTFAFFHPLGNWPFSMQGSKIISKSFEMDSPQILNIPILIISWPWALVRSRSRIILEISLLLNDIDETNLSVLFKNLEGSVLESFIKGHCSAKKELNISALSLKSVTYLFWCFKGGIQGIFLLFKISSKLTNRTSCWSLNRPTFLISGSSISVYYFQLLNPIRFGDI